LSGSGTREGEGLPKWALGGGLVLGLLLAGNLAVAFMEWPEEGDPQGFLTPDMLRGVGLWGAIGLLAIACGYGLFCAEQLKTRNDARGVGWLRGAFAFGLVGVTVLAIATFEPETFRREDIILMALWIYAVQMMFFGRQAASQAGRGGASRKHKRKRKPAKSKSGAAAPPAVDVPTEPGPTTP